MYIQIGVRLLGIAYLVFGVAGFLPLGVVNPLHHEGVGVRYLFNLVAINTIHNLIHIAIGITGVFAARSLSSSRRWGKIWGPILLLLFVGGMIQAFMEGLPPDQLFLGIVPLNSPGHVLHLVSGGIALYLGLIRPQRQL